MPALHDFGAREGLIDAKVAPGTMQLGRSGNVPGRARHRNCRGAALARALAAAGCKVLGFGEMGIGNTAAASLITHHLTGRRWPTALPRHRPRRPGLARKRAARAGRRARRPAGRDQWQRTRANRAGRVRRFRDRHDGRRHARRRRTGMVLLIDGFIVGSAFLVAARIAPAIVTMPCSATARPSRGIRHQLQALDAQPLIDLGLRLGEGTGAALAWPLLLRAVAFLNEMASFESAGVSEKH